MTQELADRVVARFIFQPDRAHEFMDDGTHVKEFFFDDIEEVIEYCEEFKDALIDCIVNYNGQIITASQFTVKQ
jgi:uncharacterized protein YprB with RNaseH-like and TPR domain